MTSDFDLDAYVERIGFTGRRTPTLDVLAALHLRHVQAIPFENLDPVLGRPVHLDAASLQRKLVRDRRGGYCYEQNLLFGRALRELGFQVRDLAARVLLNVPEGTTTPRSHMLLRIDLEGRPYVADVGFGGLTLTGPLRLEADVEQATPHEPFRLLRAHDGFLMQARIGGGWRSLYAFDLQEQLLVDYEVTSWYLSNHPASHFVTGLIAARPEPDRRYALRNGELAIHHLGGDTERRRIDDARELRDVLGGLFRVNVPEGPDVDAALARVLPASR